MVNTSSSAAAVFSPTLIALGSRLNRVGDRRTMRGEDSVVTYSCVSSAVPSSPSTAVTCAASINIQPDS